MTRGGDGPKVGLAYDVGGRGDQSFNDSAYAGLEKAVEELDATCTEAEAQAGENEADREERLRALADAGYNPIIGVGFIYSARPTRSRRSTPRSTSRSSTASTPTAEEPNDNVANLNFAAKQGSFLVGVAAALEDQGRPRRLRRRRQHAADPEVRGRLQRRRRGGRPEASRSRRVPHRGDDPARASRTRPAARPPPTGMYDNGADMVYHAAGKSGLRRLRRRGRGRRGQLGDRRRLRPVPHRADEAQKPHILTSMLKRVDTGDVRHASRRSPTSEPLVELRHLRPGRRRRRLLHLRWLHRRHHDQIDDYASRSRAARSRSRPHPDQLRAESNGARGHAVA